MSVVVVEEDGAEAVAIVFDARLLVALVALVALVVLEVVFVVGDVGTAEAGSSTASSINGLLDERLRVCDSESAADAAVTVEATVAS